MCLNQRGALDTVWSSVNLFWQLFNQDSRKRPGVSAEKPGLKWLSEQEGSSSEFGGSFLLSYTSIQAKSVTRCFLDKKSFRYSCKSQCYGFFFIVLVAQVFELRASHLLSRHTNTLGYFSKTVSHFCLEPLSELLGPPAGQELQMFTMTPDLFVEMMSH
jgi:hypothetical protein